MGGFLCGTQPRLAYTAQFKPEPSEHYEVRAVLQHPLLTLYGEPVPLR